jgi:hypothetical protein
MLVAKVFLDSLNKTLRIVKVQVMVRFFNDENMGVFSLEGVMVHYFLTRVSQHPVDVSKVKAYWNR